MERGSRRLLHDLHALSRAFEDRLPARERLRNELGPALSRTLGQLSPSRPRRVA